MAIIAIVVFLCLILSSIFLSKLFMDIQYSNLKNIATQLEASLKGNTTPEKIAINLEDSTGALLMEDGTLYNLSRNKINIMPLFRDVNFTDLGEKGNIKNRSGVEYLYYKLPIKNGDIIVIQDYQSSSNYLKVVYIILLLVFILAIILAIPMISFIGRKITMPILKLQRASSEIAQGNFLVDMKVSTKDELEDLSISLQAMAVSLEKKYTLQRDFIANVSHDFKTPLSIIRNYSEAIYDGLLEEEASKEYSKEIIREVDRLNSLVMDIMQLSKLQGGAYSLRLEWIDLKEFLSECSNRFSSLAKNKNIEITILSPEVEIEADYNYLIRVLYNFIENALKFSYENSKVQVEAIKVKSGIKISVRNIGEGIEKDLLVDVWSRYYKHNKSGGMGLGLAICSEILNLHGFTYGADSVAKGITEFYFIIPKVKTKFD